MRITGGEYAGRTLTLPKGPRIRPTRTQVRQALFNILGDRPKGARVLDLFAGTGALGIEALSRGASQVTFVERSGFCIAAIETNLENLLGSDSWGSYTLLKADVLSAIPKLVVKGKLFDGVLLDPPYGKDLARKTLIALCHSAIVSQSGWVVAEQDKRDPLPPALEGSAGRLVSQRIEIYGDTSLAFYENSSLSGHV